MSISTQLKEKIRLLRKWDDSYYNKNVSLVSDEKYDLLKDYIFRSLPPDSNELQDLLQKVGHKPSSGWKKESHLIAMGSQNKVSNIKAINDWWNGVLRDISVKSPKTILQHKLDGFSLEIKYKKGMLVSAVTRGDGFVGENINQNARKFRDLPGKLALDSDVVVRCEAYITKSDFDKIQKLTNNAYKNVRNAASGISRRYDGKYSEYIRIRSFDVNANVESESQKLIILKKLGFKIVTTYVCESIQDVIDIYQEYKDSKRSDLEYEIDGLVLKLDKISHQDQLGDLNNRPNGQVALKFNSDQAITKLNKISLQVGRTGKISPVGILEPVDLMGSTVKKATLHNFAQIEANFLSPGAEVVIEKKGDIIPQIVDIMTPGEGYERPSLCPSCGGTLEWDNVNLWCRNKDCKDRETARIRYWMKILDMKGFSDSFVEKLWNTGKVRNVGDIYRLTPDDLTNIEGLGEKTIKNFFKTLKKTSSMQLEQFIVAMGIPSVSKATAQLLVAEFKTWDQIISVSPGELEKMPGFARVSSENTVLGIREVSGMAEELLKVIEIKEKKKGTLTGCSFCVTGSLESMSRKEFEDFVVDHGGTFKSGVSVGLNYLVTNSPDSGSGKNGKAKKINEKMASDDEKIIKIITEKEFLDLAGDIPEKKSNADKELEGPVLEFHPLF